MSVEGINVDDLHQELAQAVPGSPEEKSVLAKLRDRREHKTDEFRVIRNAGMSEAAHEGVIRGRDAQHAAEIAVRQVTGEHEIPVDVIEHPDQVH